MFEDPVPTPYRVPYAVVWRSVQVSVTRIHMCCFRDPFPTKEIGGISAKGRGVNAITIDDDQLVVVARSDVLLTIPPQDARLEGGVGAVVSVRRGLSACRADLASCACVRLFFDTRAWKREGGKQRSASR